MPPVTKPALFSATAPGVVNAVVTFVPPTVRLPPLIAPLAVTVVTPVNAPPLNVAFPSVRLVTVVAPAFNLPAIVVASSVAVIFLVLSAFVLTAVSSADRFSPVVLAFFT